MVRSLTGAQNDGGLVNELEKWWRGLIGKLNLQAPQDTVQCFATVQSILSKSECEYSTKMMAVVKNEVCKSKNVA